MYICVFCIYQINVFFSAVPDTGGAVVGTGNQHVATLAHRHAPHLCIGVV